MTFGSLFSGIGGFDLGLERAGMECRWQVEIDPFCRRVLEKHWPHVRRYEDVRKVHARDSRLGWCGFCLDSRVDVLCGGFPCQDISVAGSGAGLGGHRSGLWVEFGRLIGELRPRFVIVENVSALLGRGLGDVLGDLAARGYDAEWDCVPAFAAGLPHIRDRVWIVAYPCDSGQRQLLQSLGELGGNAEADAWRDGETWDVAGWLSAAWPTESRIQRVADGIPNRVDRLRGLGNAIVPQIAEWIGRRLMECAS